MSVLAQRPHCVSRVLCHDIPCADQGRSVPPQNTTRRNVLVTIMKFRLDASGEAKKCAGATAYNKMVIIRKNTGDHDERRSEICGGSKQCNYAKQRQRRTPCGNSTARMTTMNVVTNARGQRAKQLSQHANRSSHRNFDKRMHGQINTVCKYGFKKQIHYTRRVLARARNTFGQSATSEHDCSRRNTFHLCPDEQTADKCILAFGWAFSSDCQGRRGANKLTSTRVKWSARWGRSFRPEHAVRAMEYLRYGCRGALRVFSRLVVILVFGML